MIHVISHGRHGESRLLTEPDEAEAEFAVMELLAAEPDAVAGPVVLRVTGDYGAHVFVPGNGISRGYF